MTGTKITMTGIDEAHYLSISKETSRLIKFPDGVSRHITLTNWHWEVLDRLYKDKGWSKKEIPCLAFEHAQEGVMYPDNFEQQLRFSFKLFVELNMGYVTTESDLAIANQNI